MIQRNYGQDDGRGKAGESSQIPSRRSLVVKRFQRENMQRRFTRAMVRARAVERHDANAAGVATISWMPRTSERTRHAIIRFPKGIQR